jgi:hypothetical protein
MAAGGKKLIKAAQKYPPAKFVQDFNLLYQRHEQIKALMVQAIQIEINDTMFKIKKLMWSKDIDYQELDEDKLTAQSEKIKANIDRMLGGKEGTKKYQQDEQKFAELGKEMGIEQAAGAIDNEYLQKMQAYLNFLNQMKAAIAASK